MESNWEPPEGWVCTDPDTYQYRQDLSATEFVFRQFDGNYEATDPRKVSNWPEEMTDEIWEDVFQWTEEIIDVFNYSPSECLDYLASFYKKEEAIQFIVNQDWAIVAECIFETNYLNP